MRTCQICSHPERESLEAQIKAGHSYRDVARQFQVSKDALFRHKAHLVGLEAVGIVPRSPSRAIQVAEGKPAPDVDVRDLKRLRAAAWGNKEDLCLQALTEDKVKELKGRDLAVAAGICSDKHRQWRDLDRSGSDVPLSIPGPLLKAMMLALRIDVTVSGSMSAQAVDLTGKP